MLKFKVFGALFLLTLSTFSRASEKELRVEISELFKEAVQAMSLKEYARAIELGEKIKKIKVSGDSWKEADRLIEKAKKMQSEGHQPASN